MGYDVVITRAASSLNTEEHPITWAEWMAVVDAAPTLQLSSTDWYERRKADKSIERIYDVLWLAHPDTPPFLLIDRAVQIKNPDDATVEKMVEIARSLKARVLGEEDEEYFLAEGILQTK